MKCGCYFVLISHDQDFILVPTQLYMHNNERLRYCIVAHNVSLVSVY